jgi:antitoxin component YwqK of YwqJK toxin-antitoxin module
VGFLPGYSAVVACSWGGNGSVSRVALAAALAFALASCAHGQTVCPRGSTLARRIYSGGSESEWCHLEGDRIRQGADVHYYESGVRLMEGTYVDGVQHGEWRYFWNTGEMWRVEVWNDGELVEKKTVTRAVKVSAAQHSELGFTNSGIIKMGAYDPAVRRRQLEQDSHSFSESYPDGRPRALGRYDGDGARWGFWWFWYPNGRLAREVEYDAGVRHHGFREWYDNGHARTDGTYVSGRKDGHWRRWDAAGHRMKGEDFRDGVPVAATNISGDAPVIQSPP